MAEDTNHHMSASNETDKMDEDKSKVDSEKKPSLAVKKRVVAVPHYLRPSTGSCHDACKYGKPHVFKEKPWRAVRRMSTPLLKAENIEQIQIFVDKKARKSVGIDKIECPPSDEAPATKTTLKKSSLSSRKSPLHSSSKLVEVDKLEGLPSNEATATNATLKKSSPSSRRSPLHDSSLVEVDKLEGSPSNEPPTTNATLKKSSLSSRKPPLDSSSKLVEVDKLEGPPSNDAPATNATVKKSFLSSRKSPLHNSSKLVEVDELEGPSSDEASGTNATKKSFLSSRKSPLHDSSKLVEVDKLEGSPSNEAPTTNTLKKSSLSSTKSPLDSSSKLVEVDKLVGPPSNEATATNATLKKSSPSSRRSPLHDSSKLVEVDELEGPPSDEAFATNAILKKRFLSSRKSPLHDSSKLVEVDKLEGPPSDEAPATNATLKKSFLSSRKSPLHDSSKFVKQEARPFINSSPKTPKLMRKAVLSHDRSSFADISKLLKQKDVSVSKNDLVSKSTLSTPRVRSLSAGPVRPNRVALRPSLSPDAFEGLRRKPAIDTNLSDRPRKIITPTTTTTLFVKRYRGLDVKKPLGLPQAKNSLHSSRSKSVHSNNARMTSGTGQKDRIMINKAEVKTPDEMVREKTLHMIETKEVSNHFIQSPSPLSPESLNSSSQGNSNSFTSNEVELATASTDSDVDDSVSNYNRSGNSPAVDQGSTSLKLKFRRGRVIELESGSQGPRKLRFKQGTVLGDDQVASLGPRRKSLKKIVVNSDSKEVDTEQKKVALKHQEMVTKKDEQGLYNNVLQETASKLVEKRKSKVKALVGAFETVISLQERKPSSANK